MQKRFILTCILIVLFTTGTYSQAPAVFYEKDRTLKNALELFDKEKYASAIDLFDEVAQRDLVNEISAQAEYMAAQCAILLYHRDAEARLLNFVDDHPNSPYVKTAYFELGNYNFQKRKFIKAVVWYDQVDINDLNDEQQKDYYFRKGYSHFREDEFSYAKGYLSNLVEEQNKYFIPANYYYGHIAYEEANYQVALNSFEKVKDQEAFQGLVPLYLSQIYFKQEKYTDVVSYAPDKLDDVNIERKPEMLRMIGESFYRIKNYSEAAEYLQLYANSSGFKDREGYYELGFSYYKTENFPKAIEYFTKVSFKEDSLSQLTAYQLGDAYLKNQEKVKARNAFKQASTYSFDQQLQEDALFNFAKLAYELSIDPFHEAIQALSTYLEKYPNSERSSEAYEFLLDVYLTTKNYGAAYEALNNISDKSIRTKEIYQTVVYNRGIEFIKGKRFGKANEFLAKVGEYPVDESINAKAKFWLAEILYKQKKFDQALLAYKAFKVHPGSLRSGYFNSANYSLGYTYFNQKNYAESRNYFKQYIDEYNESNKKKLNDAYLRLADSHFVQKDYPAAISNYNRAREVEVFDQDYALFQISRCYGYSNQLENKIDELMRLLNDYPQSPYIAASKFEIGDSYFKLNELDQAYSYLNDVVMNHESSAYVKRSLKTIGLIYYRQERLDEAIAAFKQVIENYANDADSKEALDRLKDIYAETGQTDEFDQWAGNLDNIDISTAALDSVAYRAAENKYIDGDCAGARPAFDSYIRKYQPGIFGLNANFYKAECDFEAGDYIAALVGYNFVIGQPKNQFTEPALLAAASISYDQKNYDEALANYIALERNSEYNINILEARIGQMRCYYFLGQKDNCMEYIGWVIDDPQTPEMVVSEAYYFKANIHEKRSELDEAIQAFNYTSLKNNGSLGAEAKFHKCRLLYETRKFSESESEVFDLIQKYPSQEKWKIEAFLLLADVYIGLEDLFQAKTTLQSILDNVNDEEIQARALAKYEEILKLEADRDAATEDEDTEIIIDGNE